MSRKRSRRWLRLVVPPVAVLLLMLLGTVVYQWGEPDLDDPAYLAPDNVSGIGASQLAMRVRQAGVEIIPERQSSDALVAAYAGNATLLLTTPQLMHKYYLRMLKLLPATTRVVIVEPDGTTIAEGLLPMRGSARNYVAKTAAPGCDYAPAAQAGTAAVVRTRYGEVDPEYGREVARCYAGSLVAYQRNGVNVTVVGSADPFRNDRAAEHGNAKLATALLTGAPRLIWLDLHHREPPPGVTNDPALAGGPAAPPSLRPHQPGDPDDPDFPVKGKGANPPPPGQGNVGGDDGDQNRDSEPPNPLWSAFPPWTYVATALLVLGAVALAVAMARRLGAPVVEPLPVVVRSSETAIGRGRLYQRAKARAESLQILRDAAIVRLTRLLRLEPDVQRPVLVEAVAASSGWPPAAVEHTLFGPPPDNDQELVGAAVRLEQLVTAVTTENPGAQPGNAVTTENPGAQPGNAVTTENPGAQPVAAAPIEGEPR
ncbi:DUF4350 domain-containing protein [Dactylosporangium sp. CS-033363]|uniref:DUF4350 domain-containing protein n=1 Tax=Dactylosporangium sp. CS-033363 TaxID=3239935 RepID=UPI003D907EC9